MISKGPWKTWYSPVGSDWVVVDAEGNLVCREARHFNAAYLAGVPLMLERLQATASEYESIRKGLDQGMNPNNIDWPSIFCRIVDQTRAVLKTMETEPSKEAAR